MADVAVRTAISGLVPLLVDEAKLLQNVHREVASIKAELEIISSFLKDADSRAETGNERAKTWVKQVREVAYQIEDVIEEYILRLAEQRQRCGFIGFLKKVGRSIVKLKPKYEIASQIEDIKQSIGEIKERADRYGFSSIDQDSGSKAEENTWDGPRFASLFIEEDEVVGIESTREELVHRLITEEPNRTVTSLVGMGGCGKTTLAKKVYDNRQVFGHFHCRAWISVSQSYKMEELFRRMVKQFCQSRKEPEPYGIDAMDQNSLIHMLREYLIQKRYVIVFDDVWKNNFWSFLKIALPKNSQGSRIIITTRSEDVASFCKDSSLDHVYVVQPLPEDEAWKLFCMKPFQCDFGGRCPPELENVSHAILRKCEGLPLAIATIGALLSTKNKGVSEWKKFCYSLGSQLEKNSNLSNIRKILLLSFYDMPDYLKPCFLYFGLLPEDYQMSGERLVRLWIAEGFLEKQKGKTLEEVGEEYLIELVHKNLVQISERGFDGGIRSCRVHDLVREIVLTKSVELGFCHVLAEEDSSLVNQARRVSMHMNNTVDKVLENTSMKPRVRSVLIFSVGVLPNKQLLSTLAANFKLLKVLDLQDAPLDQLDDEVGNLLHLRYLSVMNTKVKIIPKSIGNLHNLQTLNLANSLVSVLPLGINRLRKLRHLIAYSWNVEAHFFGVDRVRGVKIQGGIGHLEELQTLWNLESSHDDGIDGTTNLSKVLENLRQLRKLGILKLKRGHGRALCVAIGKMKHLQTLRIVAISADEILDLHSLSSPPECLQHLFLSGRLEKLPEWIPKLEDLKEVFLRWSGLTGDAIKALQALPNLIKLVLYDGYDGDQLYFEVGGFQKLQLLYLRALKGLNSITIEQGALPLLNELEIGPSPQLKEVPCGIHHLTKLSTLYFLEMPTEFMDRIQVERGQDYWIVKHIPDVKFFFFNRGDFNSYTPREFQDARERESLDEANNGSQS